MATKVQWQGYTPGSTAAIAAAASYTPPASLGGLEPGAPSYEPPLPTSIAAPTAVGYPTVITVIAGQETEDTVFDGVSQLGAAGIGSEDVATATVYTPATTNGGMTATEMGLPIVAGVATMTLGVFKALLAKYGAYILKLLIGSAAFAGFMKLLGVGAPDETELPIKPGQRTKRRYSIGSNPRVRTLQRVSRHCQKLLKRHEKVIREFLPSRKQALPARALARTYLSTAEKKALAAGS